MKLSTEFLEEKTVKDKNKYFNLANIKRVNHLLNFFII